MSLLPTPSTDRTKQLLTPLLALAMTLPALGQATKEAPPSTPAPKAAPTPSETTDGEEKKEETIELTPFVIVQEKEQGYFAENTLAGSRLKTNVGDLAASISVVTKQQMEDTASLDINDIFRFEANTEGSGSYTPVVTDRGTAKDTVAGYTLGNDGGTTTNAQSNRVRGLGAPDSAMNFYATNSRVPLDAYNTQSVEINRGPNSMLFGLGTPSGIVNQSTAQAVLGKDSNRIQFRTDHLGSERASFAVNRTLINNKLAVYFAGVYNNQQFERKPSYDITRRQYGAVTVRPFRKTIIRAFGENYNNSANRPNFLTPRDFVTPWLQAGRPAYDAVARTITKLDTNQVYGPYVFNNASPGRNPLIPNGTAGLTTLTSPGYVEGIAFDNGARPVLRIDNGDEVDYFQRALQFYRTAWTNPQAAVPTATTFGWVANDPRYAVADRQWTGSTNRPAPTTTLNNLPATYGTWQFPAITDKNIYDWTKYNTLQSNFGKTLARNYNVELEQEILPDLYFSAGWFRQKMTTRDNMTISQLTGATVQVDTNVKLPDGSTNAYFGLPYLTDSAPDTFLGEEFNDNYRAMLAYDLDLQKRGGWMTWLGRHRLFSMWSEQTLNRATERWRLVFVDGDADGKLRYLPNNLISGNNIWNQTITRQYYLASPGDAQGRVSHSLGNFGNAGWEEPYTTTIRVPDQQTGVYRNVNMTLNTAFSDAGSFRFKRNLESYNLSSQSFLFKNRLIATLGWRRDKLELQRTSTGIYTNDAGGTVPALTSAQLYDSTNQYTNYNLVMNRWTPKQRYQYDTKTLGTALKPFMGWGFIDGPASRGNPIAKVLAGTTFYYNFSDNWNPPATVVTDYFRQALPTPTGRDKSYGVGFSVLENKLVARLTWFETENKDERTGIAGTLITRLAYGDTTLMQPWAESVVRLRNGANPLTQTNWNSNNVVDVSSGALQQQVWELMKLPVNYYAGLSPGATQNSKAKGTELNLTYNPTKSITMKLTGSETRSTYTNVAPEYDSWLAVRMPVWQAAVANDIPDFTDANGTQYSLKNFWSSYGYNSAARISNTDGNTNAGNYFNNTVVSQVGLAKAQEGVVSANQRRYRASFLGNYRFLQGRLNGWSVGGSVRWESKAAIGYLGRAADPTRPQVINAVDPNKPVYLDNGRYFVDVNVGYNRKIFKGKVNMRVQLNVDNVLEGGGLEAIAVNYDGSPWAYRIVDPRRFILTTTFDF